MLEAGLMQNPFFSGSIRFPSKSGYNMNNLFDAALSFLDLFLIPLRKSAVEAEILVIEAEIGQRVLDLVRDVQTNWLEVKALELQLEQEENRVELKRLAAGLASVQKTAGNISPLTARNKQIHYEEAVERQKGLEADLETAREKMNRALGLFGKEAHWKISGEFTWKDESDFPDLIIFFFYLFSYLLNILICFTIRHIRIF